MLEGASVFITGGAGFIGSTLVGKLVENNKITIYDNFRRDAVSKTSLADHPNVTIIRGDILDAEGVAKAMSGHDHVVHCAAIAGIDTVIQSPVTTMRVNVIGSANVLAAANELPNLKRVVCFSTSEVFGQRAFRSSETDATVMGRVGEARWTYAVSKLAEEHLAIAYHTEFKMPVAVVRPFNVYGPGQVGEGALRIFIERAIRDETIQIHGDGTQIRAWCYVDDMVKGVLLGSDPPKGRRRVVQHRQPTCGDNDLRPRQHRGPSSQLAFEDRIRPAGFSRRRAPYSLGRKGEGTHRIRSRRRPRRRHCPNRSCDPRPS